MSPYFTRQSHPIKAHPTGASAGPRPLSAPASAIPSSQKKTGIEENYLSKLVIMVLVALVLPAICLLLYTAFNHEAFQHTLIP